MTNVLVIGSTGQIGSELTMKLRREIPGSTVVAGYIPGAEPKGELLESGPAEIADVRDAKALADIVSKYKIDTIYNLAALLSAVAERKPLLAWDIQMNGLLNILEVAREKGVAVFTPSSIGSFGPETKAACRVIGKGDKGLLVSILQAGLLVHGIQDTKIDAIFGAGTEEGVREFQSRSGIAVDGIAGAQTFEKLID